MSGGFLQSDDNALNIDNIDLDLDKLIETVVSGNDILSEIEAKVSTAELQVSGLSILNSININVGNQNDLSASSDTGSFSLISFIKRSLENWTSLLARIPFLVSGRIPIDGSGVTQPISGSISVNNFPTSTPGLTNDELRASPVPVSVSGLNITIPSGTSFQIDLSETNHIISTGNDIVSKIDINLGQQSDSPAVNNIGSFSLISLFKRLLEKLDFIVNSMSMFGGTLDSSGFTLDYLFQNISTSTLQVSGNTTLTEIDTKLSSVIGVDNETNIPQLITASKGHVCIDNSTNTLLGSNGIFLGAVWQDTLDYSEIIVSINTNQNSATDGLIIQWSSDGVNVHETDEFTITANVGKTFSFPCNRRYIRVKYTNGSIAQTIFNIETLLKRFGSKGSSHRLKDDLNEQDDAIVTKTLIAGKTTGGGGGIVNVKVNPSGALTVDATISSSALPIGASTSALQTTGNNSLSSIDNKLKSTSTKELLVELSGNNISAFGDINIASFTPLVQLDFVYGINIQTGKSTITSTGIVDTNLSRLRLQTGTNSTGGAIFESLRPAKYRPGQGIDARFTFAFDTPVVNSRQEMGVGNLTDGYFFGYIDTQFGIIHRNNSVETFIPQSDWNIDKCDGTGSSGVTLNPLFGNIGRVKYPFLGYGNIFFLIENPITSIFMVVHIIHYVNTTKLVQLNNPNLQFWSRIVNSGNTSNLTMYCGSVGVFLSGERKFLGATWGTNNNKTGISTTITNILTIKNCTTYNGVANKSLIRLKSISFASDSGNSIATLLLIKNATVGGTLTYVTIAGTSGDNGVTITNGNSVSSVNTIGTTVTGGQQMFNTSLARNSSSFLPVVELDIFLEPGSTMTFACFATASSNIGITVNWSEEV